MILKEVLVAIGLVSVSLPTYAVTEAWTVLTPESVYKFRGHSINHSNVKARNMQMLYASGLANGCQSLYYYADQDAFLHSVALSAYEKREKITVIYDVDTATRGPWGDPSSCMLTSVTIEK